MAIALTQITVTAAPEMTIQLPLQTKLKSQLTVELNEMREQEIPSVYSLFNLVVMEGDSYPQQSPLSESEFAAYWLAGRAYVVRGDDSILGAFYIKPNFIGRGSHICNAGFIVQPAYRGQGIGRFMGTSALPLAKQLGYRGIMFNLVFATNRASIAIWKSLGFTKLGCIPNAVQLDNGCFIDALIFYRDL
ncbi:MAG: N-acetyltransferase family protein [Synechococcus sp.]